MNKNLSYTNDDHRLYGCAGMAISLVVYDGEQMLASLCVDNPAGEMMEMSNTFYFNGNPSLSAKAAWAQIVRNFHLTSAMAIGNALCRSIVLEGKPLSEAHHRRLHDTVMQEARETCSLEDDETERLFRKDLTYLTRVFSHSGVQDIARDFVILLKDRRRMTRSEVIDALRPIASL